MSETVPIELYQSWHNRAIKAEKALMFYATKDHWMALSEDDGPRTVFVAQAGDCAGVDGWAKARKVLFEEPLGEDQPNE